MINAIQLAGRANWRYCNRSVRGIYNPVLKALLLLLAEGLYPRAYLWCIEVFIAALSAIIYLYNLSGEISTSSYWAREYTGETTVSDLTPRYFCNFARADGSCVIR